MPLFRNDVMSFCKTFAPSQCSVRLITAVIIVNYVCDVIQLSWMRSDVFSCFHNIAKTATNHTCIFARNHTTNMPRIWYQQQKYLIFDTHSWTPATFLQGIFVLLLKTSAERSTTPGRFSQCFVAQQGQLVSRCCDVMRSWQSKHLISWHGRHQEIFQGGA